MGLCCRKGRGISGRSSDVHRPLCTRELNENNITCQVLELDTTFGGLLSTNTSNVKSDKNLTYIDATGVEVPLIEGNGEVSLAYLKSYENIGAAEVRALQMYPSSCSRAPALWVGTTSQLMTHRWNASAVAPAKKNSSTASGRRPTQYLTTTGFLSRRRQNAGSRQDQMVNSTLIFTV